MKYKVLVTGGAGFIGSFLVDELIEKGHDVRIFDNFDRQVHPTGRPKYLNKQAEILEGDVTDKEALKKALNDIEIVFHEAASVGIGQSNYQISKYVGTNSLGTANLLDILANTSHSVKRLIVASSNTSYGEGLYACDRCGTFHAKIRDSAHYNKYGLNMICPRCSKKAEPIPTPEDTRLLCNSIYALTKKDQEDYISFFGKMYNVPFTVLRYFNVFGPRQSLSNPYTGVIAIFLSRIKNNKPPIIYEDGQQTRDFISVHDIVRANIISMEKNSAKNQIFNVGTGKPKTIQLVAKTLSKLLRKEINPIITNKFRKGDIRHCYADIKKINDKLDFQTKIDFEEGLKELVEWSQSEKANDLFDQATSELEKRKLI
jgi:dTDP-L-rhamnose 4-epimerase